MLDRLRSAKRQKGNVILLVTFAAVPMIGMVGLVTDLGYMHYVKKSAQAAADSAALAAVYSYNRLASGVGNCAIQWVCNATPQPCPSNPTASDPVQTACLYAKQNGFSPVNSNQTVSYQSNITPTVPTAPGVNGVAWWITVRVTQTVPQLFSAIMGNTSGLVAARASAAVQPGLGCVYALDPTYGGSYYQNGSTNFTSACAIYVDSNDPAAMLGNGGANVQASMINVTGGISWQGTMSPTPNTGVQPIPDPLSWLQPPSPCASTGGCDSAGCPSNSHALQVNGSTTLSPGIYCGGIAVKNGTATFLPGQYILVGGGLSTQDSNSHVVGSGAFFYNTYSSTLAYQSIQFNANSDVEIAAPTSGYYSGILVMQDRTCCSTTIPTESFQGGATSFFEGVIYFPRSLVQFAGNPSLSIAHYTIVIARRFAVQGTSYMNNDFSHLTGGNPIKQTGLVE